MRPENDILMKIRFFGLGNDTIEYDTPSGKSVSEQACDVFNTSCLIPTRFTEVGNRLIYKTLTTNNL